MDKQKVMLEIKSAEAWIHALSDDYKPRRKIKGLVNADADTLTSSKQNLKKDTVHSHITTSAHFRQEE